MKEALGSDAVSTTFVLILIRRSQMIVPNRHHEADQIIQKTGQRVNIVQLFSFASGLVYFLTLLASKDPEQGSQLLNRVKTTLSVIFIDFCNYVLILSLTLAARLDQVGRGATKDWENCAVHLLGTIHR